MGDGSTAAPIVGGTGQWRGIIDKALAVPGPAGTNGCRRLLRSGWLLLLTIWLLSATALAAPRIGMVTMQPGEIFWERFGHNAIVVLDPQTNAAISYNFGFFDPSEPDFIARFVRGDMRYRLAAVPFDDDMALYRDEGRGVSVQWLDLEDAQAQSVADALALNALPGNAHYRYDYFLDNCSTRVRDAIDRALGGGLRPQLVGRSQGNTLRSEALRLVSPAPWMWTGFDILLGPDADRPQALWGDAFVPMRLAAALRESRNTAGRPLVRDERVVLPHRIAPAPTGSPTPWWPWALAGIAIAAGLTWLGGRSPRALAAIALPFWSLCGLIGTVLLSAWLFTEHRIIWANHNLLLFSPLCWLLLPGGWGMLRGRAAGRFFRYALLAILALATAALFLHWLPLLPQRNAHWIALLWPIHAALAWALAHKPAPPPCRLTLGNAEKEVGVVDMLPPACPDWVAPSRCRA